MIAFFLVLLTLFDVAILAVFYLNMRRSTHDAEILTEITEERRIFAEMLNSAREEITRGKAEAKQTMNQIKGVAAQIEQEIKNSKDTIGAHMNEIIKELSEQVEKPLGELAKKQHTLELLLRKLGTERERIIKVISKGEKICKFFNEQIPYEEVLKDIEYKKYDDARKLLAQGLPGEQVASELGLSLSEIQLVQGLAQF